VIGVVLVSLWLGFELPLRIDLDDLPMWLSWGCTLVELLIGILIIGLALRTSIPGEAVPATTARTAVVAALGLQIVVGVVTWIFSPGVPIGNAFWQQGIGCTTNDAVRVLPVLAVTLWLVFRALPLKSAMAGALGGTGAAITGDAITHLLCPVSDLRHVLVWHTGAILGFMAVGWLVGTLWARVRWR
jgi:hypothetical protein